MAEKRQRAQRFPLPLPLRYRLSGASDWSSGHTQNISGSGVLFGADCVLAIGTQIELQMALEVDGESYPSEVLARARIVRVLAHPSQSAGATMAASFERYELLPRQVGQA